MDTSRSLLTLFLHLLAGFFVLTYSVGYAFSGNGYETRCPDFCECNYDGEEPITCVGEPGNRITDIDLSYLGLTMVPRFEGQFPDVEKINLTYNSILIVPTGAFSTRNFPELCEVYLNYNLITRLERNAFDVGDLEVIDLSNNDLREVRFASFSEIGDDFEILDLRDNRIESFVLDGTTLNRQNYPSLTIFLARNRLPCSLESTPEGLEMSPYAPFCEENFIADDGATCAPSPDSELIEIVPEYCEFVLEQLSPPSPRPPPTPPPSGGPSPPPAMTSGNEGGGSGTSTLALSIGIPVAAFVIILVLVTIVMITCLCLKFKMWERKLDSAAISQVEERLMNNKLALHNYNHFLPLHSPSDSTYTRYSPAPKSPLPPIPDQGGKAWGTLPGPGGFPKLQEQTGYPSSDEIYESIDEEVYESSYIYRVESVPDRPSNRGSVSVQQVHNEAGNSTPPDHDSETGSVTVMVVEAEVLPNGPPPDNSIPPSRKQPTDAETKSHQLTSSAVPPSRLQPPDGEAQTTKDPGSDKATNSGKGSYEPEGVLPVKISPDYANVDSSQPAESVVATPSDYMEPCKSVPALPQGEVTATSTAAAGGMSEQNATATATLTESERRLSALKDAWGSQDKEDVSYLQVVL